MVKRSKGTTKVTKKGERCTAGLSVRRRVEEKGDDWKKRGKRQEACGEERAEQDKKCVMGLWEEDR